MTNKISEDGVEIIDGRAVGIYDAKLVKKTVTLTVKDDTDPAVAATCI